MKCNVYPVIERSFSLSLPPSLPTHNTLHIHVDGLNGSTQTLHRWILTLSMYAEDARRRWRGYAIYDEDESITDEG
jgi:hypothetical protein